MYTLIKLIMCNFPVILSTLLLLAFGSCGEKTKASLEVMVEDAENLLVQTAGEAKVAIKLSEKNIQEVRDNLIKVKTMSRQLNRQIEETEDEKQIASLKQSLVRASEMEKKLISSLENAKESHSKLKTQLAAIENKIEMARMELDVETKFSILENADSMDNDIKSIIDSLNKTYDSTMSELDVVRIENDIEPK